MGAPPVVATLATPGHIRAFRVEGPEATASVTGPSPAIPCPAQGARTHDNPENVAGQDRGVGDGSTSAEMIRVTATTPSLAQNRAATIVRLASLGHKRASGFQRRIRS